MGDYKSNKDRQYANRDLFNVDKSIPFGTSMAQDTFQRFPDHRPPKMCKPVQGSVELGETDEKYYSTESANNYAEKGYVKRALMRPKAGQNSIINRCGTPTPHVSMSTSDYTNHGYHKRKPITRGGNSSNNVFVSGPERYYTSESASVYAGHEGARPSRSFKPGNKVTNIGVLPENAKFNAVSTSSSSYVKYNNKKEKHNVARASKSQISELRLIDHGKPGDIYQSEASRNYATKSSDRPAKIMPKDEGLGFCEIGRKDDRQFLSEGRQNYNQKPYQPYVPPKNPNFKKYNPDKDERDFMSEARANHNHDNFNVKPLPLEDFTTKPIFPKKKGGSQRGSKAPSRQASRPATSKANDNSYFEEAPAVVQSSRKATPQPQAAASPKAEYVPTGNFKQSSRAGSTASKRSSKYSRPSHGQPSVGGGVGGIRPVAKRRN